jgi:peptidoglycan/xylan/chitin deacetylase (PgdA/CDA1 family)
MSRFLISVPETYLPERTYILAVLLGGFLGLEYDITTHGRRETQIRCRGIDDRNRMLILEDVLFETKEEEWLCPASLPKCPLWHWDVALDFPEARVLDREVPVLYGREIDGGAFCRSKDGVVRLGLDILGSSFFMLTRYEEVALVSRDQHGRFPASSSIAAKGSLLERPIVNEYLEILWAAMVRLWPGLQRPTRYFKIRPTHDVDHAFAGYRLPATRVARASLGDLLRRNRAALAVKRWQNWVRTNTMGADRDIYNTFDYLMDKSEEKGLKSAFYFMADCPNRRYDGSYMLKDPWIRQMMRQIHRRGHEIGLHTSYDTYLNPHKTAEEFKCFRTILEEENICQDRWGGRQHYLRWRAPITWRHWESAGLDYDSTLGYADRPGFRCGTCYEFPVFDLQMRRPLQLHEKPLIVMEATLLASDYLGMDYGSAWPQVNRLITACRLFRGEFVLLWHNSCLFENEDRRLYEDILKQA